MLSVAPRYLAVSFLVGALFLGSDARGQAPITWFSVADITGPADVITNGRLVISANLGPEVCEQVVNSVHFQADRAHWTRKIMVANGPVMRGQMYWPDITSGGFTLKMPYNRAAGGIGAVIPSEPAYDRIVRDGRHASPGAHVITCQLEGLTPGVAYTIQLFYGSKSRSRVTEWDNGVGGREGSGGIFLRPSGAYGGQVATGFFTADASGVQTFSNYQQAADPNANPPLLETYAACCAIQVRTAPVAGEAWANYFGAGTPGTNRQPMLGGTRCSPAFNLSDHPRTGATVTLTCENSSGTATSALVVMGAGATALPFLSGTLLVAPLLTIGVPMPPPVSPFVHDHELQLTTTLPGMPGVTYVQILQLDGGAPEGVSFTPGMRLEIGS